MIETYEQAVARTGRRWPYRTEDWPCPACGMAECDLDVEMIDSRRISCGNWRFIFTHTQTPEAPC